MPKIEWDKVGERYYETGVSRGVLYLQKSDGTYPEGVAWNGLTGVTESPSGAEASDLYADNIKYATLRSAETFAATIEAYTFPDEFYQCDGYASPADGVMLGQQSRSSFGFCYRTEVGNDTSTADDDGYKIHIVYGATASPSEKAYATTNDSPEAITMSWEIQTTPVNVEGFKPSATITIETLKVKDKDLIKKLEDVLYGSEDGTPHLPLPDEIVEIFKAEGEDVEETVTVG